MSTADSTKLCPECLTASWLAERLAVDPTPIEEMRRAGELIAVREEGSTEWLYPAWQLDGREPKRVVARLVATARESGLDETRLYELLATPTGLTGQRRRLVDLILEGRDEEVVAEVRRTGRVKSL
ncbi:hypothetical protein BH09ACT13_BH09ACT13_08860 [soil metagenome]